MAPGPSSTEQCHRPCGLMCVRSVPSSGRDQSRPGCGDFHSLFDVFLFFRDRSNRPDPPAFSPRTPRQTPHERLVGFARVPPLDAPHRRVRFQRRRIDADRLAPHQPRVGEPLQHPRENRHVRLHVDQPPRTTSSGPAPPRSRPGPETTADSANRHPPRDPRMTLSCTRRDAVHGVPLPTIRPILLSIVRPTLRAGAEVAVGLIEHATSSTGRSATRC